jgi:hypothetical protein
MPYDRDIPGQIEKEMYRAKMGNGRAEVRQTQISTECAYLVEQSEVLAKMIHELEERLNIILRPSNDDRDNIPPVRDEIKPEPLAPHADFLQIRTNALKRIGEHLGNIIQRIEL